MRHIRANFTTAYCLATAGSGFPIHTAVSVARLRLGFRKRRPLERTSNHPTCCSGIQVSVPLITTTRHALDICQYNSSDSDAVKTLGTPSDQEGCTVMLEPSIFLRYYH